MTQAAMERYLREIGVKKAFRPYSEEGRGTFLLRTRQPFQIIAGRLKGSEIALMSDTVFLVWTGRRRLAQITAKNYGLRARLVDGEAQIWIPPALADEILPKFGAKVKRQSSAKQLEALKLARQLSPALHSMQKNPCAIHTSDALTELPGVLLSPQPEKRRISHPKSD